MKSILHLSVYGVLRTVKYVAQAIAAIFLQLLAIGMIVIFVIGIPLVVKWWFPEVINFVRGHIEVAGSYQIFLPLPSLLESAKFMGIVGVLSIVPYLFTKAVETIPNSMICILREFCAIIRDRWLPELEKSGNTLHLSTMLNKRIKGLEKTIRASTSLIIALAVIAVAVAWAILELDSRQIKAVVRVNGEMTNRLVTEGIEIDVVCEGDNETLIMPEQHTLTMGNSYMVSLRCPYRDVDAGTLERIDTILGRLVGEVGRVSNYTETLPRRIDARLDSHYGLIDARIRLLQED